MCCCLFRETDNQDGSTVFPFGYKFPVSVSAILHIQFVTGRTVTGTFWRIQNYSVQLIGCIHIHSNHLTSFLWLSCIPSRGYIIVNGITGIPIVHIGGDTPLSTAQQGIGSLKNGGKREIAIPFTHQLNPPRFYVEDTGTDKCLLLMTWISNTGVRLHIYYCIVHPGLSGWFRQIEMINVTGSWKIGQIQYQVPIINNSRMFGSSPKVYAIKLSISCKCFTQSNVTGIRKSSTLCFKGN